MSRRKKITIIISLIALIGVGLLLFLEFGEPATPPSPQDEGPIFPFATTSERFFTDGDRQPTSTVTKKDTQRPDLWKISDDPVADSQWVTTNTGQKKIWYIKKASGHLYAADPQTRERTQLTNTTIPQVREAFIDPSGQVIVFRYVDDTGVIRTYFANVKDNPSGKTSYTLSGSFLPPNIYEMTLSPNGNKLFFLQEDIKTSIGSVYNTRTGVSQPVFTSDINRWRAKFKNKNTVTLFTPAADDVRGFAYNIDAKTGTKNRITAGTGLTITPSKKANTYLQTTQSGKSFITKAHTPATSSPDFSVRTISEKCNWKNTNIFLCGVPEKSIIQSINKWYQGSTNFTDNLIIFNKKTNNKDPLLNDNQVEKANADIIDIAVNESFQHLIFTNRKNGDLWGLRL